MTTLTRYLPVRDLSMLEREAERLFDRFFSGAGEAETEMPMAWVPPADVSERDDAFLIRLDLPGVKKSEVQITFENGLLTVSGERRSEHEGSHDRLHRLERWYGRFLRTFNLGMKVLPDKIKATFKNGVLTIEVPKAEESRPLRIKVA